jgi:hypothetical protein
MRVYLDNAGDKRLIGRADVPEDTGSLLEVSLFRAASVIREIYTLTIVTHLPPGGGTPVVERAVLVAPGQPAELLPGWSPLAS